MHFALPGSALVHALVLGAGLLMFAWPAPDDAPAMQSVSVDVISIASVSANQTSTIQSDATETLTSSGAEALPPIVPETVEAMDPQLQEPLVEPQAVEPPPVDPVQPVATKPVEPADIEPVTPVEAAVISPSELVEAAPLAASDPVEIIEAEPERMEMAVLSAISPVPLKAEAVAPIMPATTSPEPAAPVAPATASPHAAVPVAPVQPATLQPAEVSDYKVAPTPHVLTRPRPSEPTQRPPQQQAATPPPRATPKPPAQPHPSTPAGNGGENQADSIAAPPSSGQQGNSGSDGDAETARYPNQVLSKLRRALRYPNGARGAHGEVHVQFAVSAGGQPSGVRIVKSSGNAAIDQAGIDTVMRAAPFPPIPAGAGRGSWDFTVPLAFVRG